ncbi:hypothetical protein [Paraburkholderia caffeinilytica]|uniref:hypothetical protein n=1 Tax=Paraburkholderia caffeinilytica TaxID=1761016 RepID=UPI003DA1ABC7
MKRAAWFLAYLAAGLLVSWQSALFASRLAGRYSWPLVHGHWHGCWDFEHCSVSWLGYAVTFLFIFGPVAAWGIVGFAQAKELTVSRVAVTASILIAGTALFYVSFYAFVWQ